MSDDADLFSKCYSTHTIYLTSVNRAMIKEREQTWIGPTAPGGGESDDQVGTQPT